MKYSRKRKRRMRRRFMQRMFWRGAISAVGILLLLLMWNLTSCALHYLTPQEESRLKEDTAVEENEYSETDNVIKTMANASELLLVNKSHPLEESYQPDLTRIREYGVEVDRSISKPLMDMLAAGEKEGLSFWIASAYRSPERQRELLDEDIGALVRQGYSYSGAYEEVVKETMPVGCSEHATGLAVDIVAKDYQILDEKQARTDEIIWLQQNCSQYGFILRYPEGKEDITKVSYESWHFRYVGTAAAQEIMSQGLTLEEYMESVE